MTKDELKQHLFSERTNVYAVLDGASVDGLPTRLFEANPPHYCLFRGDLTPDVAVSAPYLVGLINGSPFTEWLLDEPFGKHWGIFAQSVRSITEMRKHFRSLVTVHDEFGKPMIFRFYDPRVLHTFLPTCNPGELKTFFGSIDTFFAETGGGKALSSYAIENNSLRQTELS